MTCPEKSRTEPLASAIARNTATFAPKRICVRLNADSRRRTHGAGITRWVASSLSSPRWAASCCTHHWQTFLPKLRGGSCRPHRIQFAMLLVKDYQECDSDASPLPQQTAAALK